MKYLLVVYLCSITTGQCPSSTFTGWQFNSHYDCVMGGYGVAQQAFKHLEETHELDVETINREKFVVKFECKQIGTNT